jgi:hypothetical protein
MGQLLFTVIALGIALLGFALLAWLQRNEREPHPNTHVQASVPRGGREEGLRSE